MMNNFDAVMWSTINHLTSEHAEISFKIKFYYNLMLFPPNFLFDFITWRWAFFSQPLFINFLKKFSFSFTFQCRIKSNSFCFTITITYIFWNSWRLGVMVVFIINFTKLIIILKLIFWCALREFLKLLPFDDKMHLNVGGTSWGTEFP